MSIFELSTLFQRLPIGAYRSDLSGMLVHANAALIRMNGYASEAEFRAKFRNQALDPYVDPQRRHEFRTLLERDGHVTHFESEMFRLNTGERMWVREHAHVLRDERGTIRYYEGTVEDITEERAAKASRQQHEAMLQNLLQTIPDRVWLKDPQGVYLTCNDAFAAALGASPAQVVGTRDTDWVDDAVAANFRASDALAMHAGKPVTLEEDMPTRQGRAPRLYELIKTPMYDAQGNAIGILGMARDIQQRKDAEALLRDTTEQLELALMGADLGRWSHDLALVHGYRLDARACLMLGRDPGESEHAHAWGHLIHPDDIAATLQAMRAHLQGHAAAYEADYRARHTDGHWVWLSSRGKVVQFGRDGAPQRMAGTLMDISQRKRAESQLRATQAELKATLNALPDPLFELTLDGVYRAIHSHNEASVIHGTAHLLGQCVSDVLPPEAANTCLDALHQAHATGRSSGLQYSLELPHGRKWFELSVARKPTEPGEEARFIAIARDITQRKNAQEALQHQALHDSLTGLPNRRLLAERLQSALTASQRSRQHGALMFLDLDRFKQLNDTHGHEVGDLMLQEVARRLQLNVRAVDTVARLGGDEFVVLLQALSQQANEAQAQAAAVGEKILSGLSLPYTLNGLEHICTPSIGLTLFCGDTLGSHDILKQADKAMYQAKARGRNTLVFL